MKLFPFRGAHYSSHLPQQVIARSPALRGATKQSHQGEDCHALWARNDTLFIVPNVPNFTLSVITLCVALILVGYVFFGSAFSQAQTKLVTAKDEESPSSKKSEGTRLRNPFLLPPGVYLLSKEGETPVRKEKASEPEAKIEKVEAPSFKVRAILISDHIRLATIGPHIVAVGDKLDGETIFEIKNDRVILGRGDKKRTLHLQQSPVQLTVEVPPPSSSPTSGEEGKGAEAQDKGGRP